MTFSHPGILRRRVGVFEDSVIQITVDALSLRSCALQVIILKGAFAPGSWSVSVLVQILDVFVAIKLRTAWGRNRIISIKLATEFGESSGKD